MIECVTHQNDWDARVRELGGHPLQLWGWGEVKARHGWKTERILVSSGDKIIGGAQLLVRPLPAPFKAFVYVPRGPFGDSRHVLGEIVQHTKTKWHPTHLSIEPAEPEITLDKGWKRSPNRILLSRTLELDLTTSPDELQQAMTKKTRQYIRKSTNDGIVVRRLEGREDIADCLAIYKQTAARAKFALHDDDYYYDLHHEMAKNSVVYGAYSGGNLVAFVWLVISDAVAFELYGGMNDLGQQLRANYCLKWHAITTCQQQGIQRYDMNGLLNDGVSTFKQGFASHETHLAGSFDYPMSPLYTIWTKALPMAKTIIRAIKQR